jgi:hypothetical protein
VVRRDRAQYVVDAITVLRAYMASGEKMQLTRFNSFEDWDLVRGALVWLGEADPVKTMQVVRDENPDLEERSRLFEVLMRWYGLGTWFRAGDLCISVREVMQDYMPRKEWNPKRSGHMLKRHRDTTLSGVSLDVNFNPHDKVQEWRLVGAPIGRLAIVNKGCELTSDDGEPKTEMCQTG